jgi:hypothetical protein
VVRDHLHLLYKIHNYTPSTDIPSEIYAEVLDLT